MKTLARLPRWLHILLLAANLLASLVVLAANWVASYPNLIAAWAQGSALLTLLPPAVVWLNRTLDAHHTALREHVDRALAAQPPEGGESP